MEDLMDRDTENSVGQKKVLWCTRVTYYQFLAISLSLNMRWNDISTPPLLIFWFWTPPETLWTTFLKLSCKGAHPLLEGSIREGPQQCMGGAARQRVVLWCLPVPASVKWSYSVLSVMRKVAAAVFSLDTQGCGLSPHGCVFKEPLLNCISFSEKSKTV